MARFLTGFALLLALSGCSGWHVALSEERTPHFRTLAIFTPEEEDKQDLAFALRKRPHRIMAEKTLFQSNGGDFSASLACGHHRQQKWMAGVTLNYAF